MRLHKPGAFPGLFFGSFARQSPPYKDEIPPVSFLPRHQAAPGLRRKIVTGTFPLPANWQSEAMRFKTPYPWLQSEFFTAVRGMVT